MATGHRVLVSEGGGGGAGRREHSSGEIKKQRHTEGEQRDHDLVERTETTKRDKTIPEILLQKFTHNRRREREGERDRDRERERERECVFPSIVFLCTFSICS